MWMIVLIVVVGGILVAYVAYLRTHPALPNFHW